MNKLLPALVGLVLFSGAWAQTLDRPIVAVGDTWTYRTTTERGPSGWNQTDQEIKVTRVTPTAIFVATKATGSTQPPQEMLLGTDWSRRNLGSKSMSSTQLRSPMAVAMMVHPASGCTTPRTSMQPMCEIQTATRLPRCAVA